MNNTSELFEKFSNGVIDRRTFLKSIIAITGCLSLNGCLAQLFSNKGEPISLTLLQINNIKAAQKHLFPKTENTPTVDEINAFEYLYFVFYDQQVDPQEKSYLIQGADWLNETCVENFQVDFFKLTDFQKEKILKLIVKKNWGEKWVSSIIKYILEALLVDPIYGGNTNGIGWNWLEHQPGFPQPNDHNLYPKILKL